MHFSKNRWWTTECLSLSNGVRRLDKFTKYKTILCRELSNSYDFNFDIPLGKGPFNRAMLLNVGAAEALKQYDFQCFIFHDVDLLPEDDRNLYTCPTQPRHMSVAINSFLYR